MSSINYLQLGSGWKKDEFMPFLRSIHLKWNPNSLILDLSFSPYSFPILLCHYLSFHINIFKCIFLVYLDLLITRWLNFWLFFFCCVCQNDFWEDFFGQSLYLHLCEFSSFVYGQMNLSICSSFKVPPFFQMDIYSFRFFS